MPLYKKGFEIGVNLIVVLIITLVIFVGGIVFSLKFFGMAAERKASIDAETQSAIESLLDTGAKVAIPIFKKQVKRGSGTTFGVGIRNVNAQSDKFHIIMSFDEAADEFGNQLAKTAEEARQIMEYINQNWISKDVSEETIKNQERRIIPVYISVKGALCDSSGPNCVSSTTRKGTYIFNVCVCNVANGFDACSSNDCLYDPSTNVGISKFDLYGKSSGGDIHKIIVEVV